MWIYRDIELINKQYVELILLHQQPINDFSLCLKPSDLSIINAITFIGCALNVIPIEIILINKTQVMLRKSRYNTILSLFKFKYIYQWNAFGECKNSFHYKDKYIHHKTFNLEKKLQNDLIQNPSTYCIP